MHGQDRRMRDLGLPGNVCHAVLALDKGVDIELLRKRVANSQIMDWLGRIRLVRSMPSFRPVWRALPEPPKVYFEHENLQLNGYVSGELPAAISGHQLLASRDPSLVLHLVLHPDKTSHLILSWNHALLDARGIDFLLRHLNGTAGENGTPALENLIHPEQDLGGLGRWWQNAMNAHRSVKWLNESGIEPLFSLLPAKAPPGPRRSFSRLLPFSEEETARIASRCEYFNVAFRRSHFYQAAALRALHTVATARGNMDGAYLAPVPHDKRRRGSKGPIFSNHLSILFYRVEPRFCGNINSILGELNRQMTEQIRTNFPECCMAALNLFKPMPLSFYVNHLGKPTRGKFASLCFSDSGETCVGMRDFCGAPIRQVVHLVPCWRPPGLTVLFLSFAGRLSASLTWVDDCLSLAEVDVLERSLRRALLEENE
jgi:hypothetical protein